jgi:hypothetical protein
MQAEHIHICLGVVITSRVRQVSWQFQTCTSSLLRVCACHIRGRVRAWIPQARRGTRTGLREKLLLINLSTLGSCGIGAASIWLDATLLLLLLLPVVCLLLLLLRLVVAACVDDP